MDNLMQKREILNNKFDLRLEKGTEIINNVNKTFLFQLKNLEDNLVPPKYSDCSFSIERNEVKMQLNDKVFGLTGLALNQLLGKMEIPVRYFKDLTKYSEASKELSMEILNSHFHKINKRRLLVRSVNDKIHGILSDKYKRFDSFYLMKEFFVACKNANLKPIDAFINDNCFYYDFVYPEIIEIKTEFNDTIPVVRRS